MRARAKSKGSVVPGGLGFKKRKRGGQGSAVSKGPFCQSKRGKARKGSSEEGKAEGPEQWRGKGLGCNGPRGKAQGDAQNKAVGAQGNRELEHQGRMGRERWVEAS